jgi:hypothetical protein
MNTDVAVYNSPNVPVVFIVVVAVSRCVPVVYVVSKD